jgi:hypothetical protein
LSIRSLKCSELLPWLSHVAFIVGAECGSAFSASIAAWTYAIPAQPFTRLGSITLSVYTGPANGGFNTTELPPVVTGEG